MVEKQRSMGTDWQSFAGDIAWPTLALLFVICLVECVLWWAVGTHRLSLWIAFPIATVAAYATFTVAHEASHDNIQGAQVQLAGLNLLCGWISAIPLFTAYPAFRVIHLQHHAHTNEGVDDPDHWVAGKTFLSVLGRCLTIVPHYYWSFLFGPASKTEGGRATKNQVILGLMVLLSLFSALIVSGRADLAIGLWLAPSILAVGFLALVFDWLPHFPHTRVGRYQDTRILLAPGLIWAMLGQNYHLIHHLHPRIPFYRYSAFFKANRDKLVDEGAIIEGWGQGLQPPLKGIPRPPGKRCIIQKTQHTGKDAITLMFDERPTFAPGQHIKLSIQKNGTWFTRPFSISSCPDAPLAITIKRNPGGEVSGWLIDHAKAKMPVHISSPRGLFTYTPGHKRILLLAGGSGITPLVSIAQAALSDGAQVTLLRVDRTPGDSLLQDRFTPGPRLSIINHFTATDGRLSDQKLTALLQQVDAKAAWLCGPAGLRDHVRSALLERGLHSDVIHEERFGAEPAPDVLRAPFHTINLTVGKKHLHFESASNETLLQAAHRGGIPLPFGCGRGECGTCVLAMDSGSVEQGPSDALLSTEAKKGRVLACLSRPTAPCHLKRSV